MEGVDIATDDAPTKEEILEALGKNNINNIEELVDALMPETGGYAWHDRDDDPPGLEVAKLKTGSINVHWHSGPGVFDPFVIGPTVILEDINMASEKTTTKAEFLAALKKKGINNLEDLVDAIMPEADETGGYIFQMISEENEDAELWLSKLKAPGRRMVLGWLMNDQFLNEENE